MILDWIHINNYEQTEEISLSEKVFLGDIKLVLPAKI